MTSDKRMSDERLDELRGSSDLRANLSETSVDELLSEIDALRADLAAAERERDRAREALAKFDVAVLSPIDGRDLLNELNPAGWHHCDIEVRIGGNDKRYEGDWLKNVWYALKDARAALKSPAPIPAQEE